MPLETVIFKGKEYPKFQTEGNSSQFIIPVARKVCKGVGYDVGCGNLEWVLPGAIPIDPQTVTGNDHHATDLPNLLVDFIFSSHCLEHIPDWVSAMEHWTQKLKSRGVLFLYLPCYSQDYWRPWNNKKHKHVLTPEIMYDIFVSLGYRSIFVSDRDANDSFSIFGERS